MRRLAALALLAPWLVAAAPQPEAGPACFHAADNKKLTMEVYQQAPPPAPQDEANYAFFPANGFASQSMAKIWAAKDGPYRLFYFQWSNRSTAGVMNPRGVLIQRKGNFQPGFSGPRDQRAGFSSTEKADACTLAQTALALGASDDKAAQYTRPQGVRLVRMRDEEKTGIAGAQDVCVGPPRAGPPKMAGVLLDYEVQDGRSPEYTLAFLTRYTDLVHKAGKQAMLLINPFDAPSQRYTGITEVNANIIHHLFDRTVIFTWSRNAQGSVADSLEKQWAILASGGPVDPRRLLIDYELNNTTLEDAAATRRFIDAHKLAGVILWRNYARQGGSCDLPVNRKMACVVYGRCGG